MLRGASVKQPKTHLSLRNGRHSRVVCIQLRNPTRNQSNFCSFPQVPILLHLRLSICRGRVLRRVYGTVKYRNRMMIVSLPHVIDILFPHGAQPKEPSGWFLGWAFELWGFHSGFKPVRIRVKKQLRKHVKHIRLPHLSGNMYYGVPAFPTTISGLPQLKSASSEYQFRHEINYDISAGQRTSTY